MTSPAFLFLLVFLGVVFLLLNGPVWVATRIRLARSGPDAPRWLQPCVTWLSRIAGGATFVVWVGTLIRVKMLSVALLAIPVSIGVFFLLNGPHWLTLRTGSRKPNQLTPSWLQTGVVLFKRALGIASILAALYVSATVS